MGPPVVLLVFLTLVGNLRHFLFLSESDQRFQPSISSLVMCTARPTRRPDLLQIWLLKRFASPIALQPILLDPILFSRRLWPEGGALVDTGAIIRYTRIKERRPGQAVLTQSLNMPSSHSGRRYSRVTLPCWKAQESSALDERRKHGGHSPLYLR